MLKLKTELFSCSAFAKGAIIKIMKPSHKVLRNPYILILTSGWRAEMNHSCWVGGRLFLVLHQFENPVYHKLPKHLLEYILHGTQKEARCQYHVPFSLADTWALSTDYGCLPGLTGTKHSCKNALIIMLFTYNLFLLLQLIFFWVAWYHGNINSISEKNKL